ncbi:MULTISPECIES: Crp/Fnr family transcriptional regulator [Carboxydocella]|uniref:Crp/Fnr family transcriptional regulator n=1 Tax=Carboxydocella TaxID=178898 RepID=UPI00099A0997|nr:MULTISPECIES: Crp/Fnr family transcriptional regulator [Carboxydocella]
MKRSYLCLHELPVFQGLDRSEFASVCISTTKKKIPKDNFLFYQGELANTIYLVKAGKLKLVQINEEGREIIIEVIGPGEIIGEEALFQKEEQKHLFSAIAMDEAMVCCFNRNQFEKLLLQNPGLAIKIISYLGQKLYKMTQHFSEVVGTSVKDKLLRLFFKLADVYGRKTSNGIVIELEITQQELGDMIGASRVMVSYALKELRNSGIIIRYGKNYILKPGHCLEKYWG